jgi:hypothetical protein
MSEMIVWPDWPTWHSEATLPTMIGPYLQADWERDMAGVALSCPDCGSSTDYGPRAAPRPDGSLRLYRACKACGFWQEADGTAPYRCRVAAHRCTVSFAEPRECRECEQPLPAGIQEHDCGRWLHTTERFTCPECGTVVGFSVS